MTHQKQPGKHGFKKRYLFLVALLAGLVAFGTLRFRAHSQLKHRIEVLQELGYPMSLAEMDALYQGTRLYDEDNAWPVYLGAFEALVKWEGQAYENLPGFGRQGRYKSGESWDPNHMQDAKAYLEDNEACLALLYEGAEIGHCFRPIDYTLGYNLILPMLSETRDCARLLKLAGQVAMQQGDVNGAIKAIEAIFVLADSLDAPTTVMDLVRKAIWRLGIAAIEDLLCHQSLTDDQIQILGAKLEFIQAVDGYKQCMIGERCFNLNIFNASPQEIAMCVSDSGQEKWPFLIVPRRLLGLHDQDVLSCINVTQAYIEATSLPRHEVYARIEMVEEEHRPKLGLLTRMFMPALKRMYQLEARVVAGSLCARTALAVEKYRLANGQLPETVDSLVPDYMASVPLDPFDGQPLRYHHLDKGYVVYSVGQDLTDNQGEERQTGDASKNQTSWDEVFIVTR